MTSSASSLTSHKRIYSRNRFPLLANCKTTRLVQMTEVLCEVIPVDFLFYFVSVHVWGASVIEELGSINRNDVGSSGGEHGL